MNDCTREDNHKTKDGCKMKMVNTAVNAHEQSVKKSTHPTPLVKCRDLPSQEMYENPKHIAPLTPPRLAILP